MRGFLSWPESGLLRRMGAWLVQQNAVHLLRKPRADGDTGKVADFEAAATDLSHAHRFFERLRKVGKWPRQSNLAHF